MKKLNCLRYQVGVNFVEQFLQEHNRIAYTHELSLGVCILPQNPPFHEFSNITRKSIGENFFFNYSAMYHL